MRLWSIHPAYLDTKGLLAAWREGLLAQKVLDGGTKGYRNHPQLERFRSCDDPLRMIGLVLLAIFGEASRRGYSFDRTKILRSGGVGRKIPVSDGQVRYEFALLLSKLERRDSAKHAEISMTGDIRLNAVFTLRRGGIEAWERPIPELAARIRNG